MGVVTASAPPTAGAVVPPYIFDKFQLGANPFGAHVGAAPAAPAISPVLQLRAVIASDPSFSVPAE